MPKPLIEYFEYEHLPTHLQEVSKGFHDLAHQLQETQVASDELAVALRKLLEAKDAAVRNAL